MARPEEKATTEVEAAEEHDERLPPPARLLQSLCFILSALWNNKDAM